MQYFIQAHKRFSTMCAQTLLANDCSIDEHSRTVDGKQWKERSWSVANRDSTCAGERAYRRDMAWVIALIPRTRTDIRKLSRAPWKKRGEKRKKEKVETKKLHPRWCRSARSNRGRNDRVPLVQAQFLSFHRVFCAILDFFFFLLSLFIIMCDVMSRFRSGVTPCQFSIGISALLKLAVRNEIDEEEVAWFWNQSYEIYYGRCLITGTWKITSSLYCKYSKASN